MDFKALNYEQFEVLVAKLLQAEGYQIKKTNRFGISGPDIIVENPSGITELVEVKHYKQREVLPASLLRKIFFDMERYSQLDSADGFIIVTSNSISQLGLYELDKLKNVRIIDGIKLNELVDRYSLISHEFETLISYQASVLDIDSAIQVKPRENKLITELKNIPAGKDGWRDYEDVCVKILNYLFLNPLSAPNIQSRTEDGLDIRDAVYAIRPGNQFWDMLRSECRTKFMVAEFKNYEEEIGQREVESIRQYLYPKAMRSFGILCSRKGPKTAAEKKRRRSWVEEEKLIAFITDEDLVDMIQLKDAGEEPFEVIDTHLEEFFSILCP